MTQVAFRSNHKCVPTKIKFKLAIIATQGSVQSLRKDESLITNAEMKIWLYRKKDSQLGSTSRFMLILCQGHSHDQRHVLSVGCAIVPHLPSAPPAPQELLGPGPTNSEAHRGQTHEQGRVFKKNRN